MGGCITKSSYLIKSNLLETNQHHYNILIKRNSLMAHQLFESSLTNFVAFLKQHNFSVVIHRAFYAEKYIDEFGNIHEFTGADEVQVVNQNNEYLEKYYNLLDAYCFLNNVTCFSIEVRKEKRYSAFANKWGKDYFHFDQIYYEELAEKLKVILS